jgi:hypothetical protein
MLERLELWSKAVILWGTVAIGYLNVIQPWLTAIATLLAIWWSARQLYASYKKDKNGDVQ